MALDRVNERLFIGHHGNSRYDIYQLDEQGLPLRRHADGGVGGSLISRGFAHGARDNIHLTNPVYGDFDEVHQRLFAPESFGLGASAARIMVFDLRPEYLARLAPGELPEAIAVLGQPDFATYAPGVGPGKIGAAGTSVGSALVDDDRQLLFYSDGANNRVLVWDIDPARLESGMEAIAVIGQDDFYANASGTSSRRMRGPGSLAYDPERRHLFVMDRDRVLVFDVSDKNLDRKTGFEAFAVLGETDFVSRKPRRNLRKLGGLGPARIALDYRYHRLFVGEMFGNRLLIFDVSPDKLQGASDPDAIGLMGQPDFDTTDPAVTRERITMPRITIDSERQLAYVPDGYPAGNNIRIYDIHPDRIRPFLNPALDQIGHLNPEGEADFLARSANDRISPRFWTQGRDVSIDRVDHRLFMSDNYGHRVMVFRLDRLNRLLDREAKWVLGQPDPYTSHLLPGRDAKRIKLPLAVEYDESHKRLFVADTWNDRVLVYDMTPGQVESGMAAAYVLGQQDFTSHAPAAARDRVNFGSRRGHGIRQVESRSAELAMDKMNQRLFVTDGGNHRVLVFDVHPDRIRNGAKAVAVLGQDDFTSTETGLSATRWRLPGDLVLDEQRQRLFVGVSWQNRVLVFDVHPDRIRNGAAATHVIGQADFTSDTAGRTQQRIAQPDGLSYDAATDRLYVSDKYNHRVMGFDVHPDRLRNLPEAVAVIGEREFDQMHSGPDEPRFYPDRLRDPRGSFFDERDQRLYQSEGVNGRMTVFTLPRERYRVDLPGRGSLAYASLDAQLSTGPEPYGAGYARASLEEPGEVLGVSVHRVTEAFLHPQSERQSRELVSAAQLAAGPAVQEGWFYVDTRSGSESVVSLVNPGGRTVRVEVSLRSVAGQVWRTRHRLGADSRWTIRPGEVFAEAGEVEGVLEVSADRPVHLAGLLEMPGSGRVRLAPLPGFLGEESAAGLLAGRRVLPGLSFGSGRSVRYVLLNPGESVLRGEIAVAGREAVPYTLPAGGVFTHTVEEAGPLQAGYAVVQATEGHAPESYALVVLRDRAGGVDGVQTVSGQQEGSLLWGAVDNAPDVLHHGEISYRLYLVAEGKVPATVYVSLFDLDGQELGYPKQYERVVPLGEQVVLDLEKFLGRSRLQGLVRVFSDSPVSMRLEEVTRTVRGRAVLVDVPLQETPDSRQEFMYPLYRNGGGQATELMLINTEREAGYAGSLSVYAADGQAQRVILR